MTPYYDKNGITIYCGDCLEVMPTLSHPFDMILADLPYGTTACDWDSIIPLEPLWEHYKRLIKYVGSIGLTASQPFASVLTMSNIEWFKYCWYWKKTKAVGFQHAKNKPMGIIEEICIFSQGSMGHSSLLGTKRMVYNPQGTTTTKTKTVSSVWHGNMMGARPNQVGKKYIAQTGFDNNLLEFNQPIGNKSVHPTQKPVALMSYLIRTYTNPGELILDNTMGSGTTLVAAQNEGRRAVGIELSEDYCKIAVDRLRQKSLFSILKPEVKKQEAKQLSISNNRK